MRRQQLSSIAYNVAPENVTSNSMCRQHDMAAEESAAHIWIVTYSNLRSSLLFIYSTTTRAQHLELINLWQQCRLLLRTYP